jgi:sterol desaturase/sphingolipid hydroxylase (fatty acid hydroxylase superfamily)
MELTPEQIQPLAFIFGGFIILLLAGEYFLPLRNRKYSFVSRLLLNAFISLFVFIIVYLFVNPAQNLALEFGVQNNFGLLQLIDLNPLLEGIIAFLLMDLAFYYWHLLNHKVPFLWRFHNIHHYDPDLDITTSFRFHFVEIFLSVFFRIIQISLIGISPAVFIIYETAFAAGTVFHHSNVKLPIKFERILNRIIVTPRMHGIHHSQRKNETNSNYSTVFSWWDLLHNTLRLNVSQNSINIGVPGYSLPEDNTYQKALLLPFMKQRKYWKEDNDRGDSINEKLKDRMKLKE